MYNRYQSFLRTRFLSELLELWFDFNKDLPEQFLNPDFKVLTPLEGNFIAFKAVSPVLKVDEHWWNEYLDEMKNDLNRYIPMCLSKIEKMQREETRKRNQSVKRGRELENARANRGYSYPDEMMEYEELQANVNLSNELLTNMQAVLSFKDYWNVQSVHQDGKNLVVELLS